MPKSLVIVESPTKARTISRFVGEDFVVESSIGHIRDLPNSAGEIPADLKKEPWARLGIDIENEFKPLYVIPSDKKKQVTKLKGLLKEVDQLYLATDEDREGEAISWHLLEVLKPKIPTHRLVFHEITKEAIQKALESPRKIDEDLVEAQETRRVLDRLYGYEISPLLWRKIAPKLSAGRVQSVSCRLIVNRERERQTFHSASFWDLAGTFVGKGTSASSGAFQATLISLGGRRMVSGKDFDERTGLVQEKSKGLNHLNQSDAEALQERLRDVAWRVIKVEQRPYTSHPPAPFTTSTLQQEANRKFSQGSRETMRQAQRLYEEGYITYMRTDSTTLSDQAVNAARKQIRERYGTEFLPDQPRVYRSKVKNAQEAHEAIRPAGETFKTPEEIKRKLESREWRLYDLIWKRTMASQMPDARGQRLVVQIEAGDAVFQATGKTIEFPGYLRAYVEGSDDPEADLGDQERLLPPLAEGDGATCKSMDTQEHNTKPPARFSEASLIKELESLGIGRPSTYASIIDTITRREYVFKKGTALVPSFTAFAVVQLLEEYFTQLVDVEFTAGMENALDAISRGELERLPYLKQFYEGEDAHPGLKQMLLSEIDPRAACTIPIGGSDRQKPIAVRIGRYGPYLESEGERAPLPIDVLPDELTFEKARELLEKGASPDILGVDPETKSNVYLKNGRYGPYVQLGEQGEEPKMKSLLPGQTPEELTFENAMQLLSLPRTLGTDESTGEVVLVDLGRYGPYARRGKDSRSLASADQLFTLTMAEAVTIFSQPKASRRGPAILREIGKHPETEVPINLMDGRFGPYVTDGDINASIPRADNPDEVTLDRALELLRERAARGPAKKSRKTAKKTPAAIKKAAKKTTSAKKASAKKTTGKKTTTKKTAAKKTTAKKATPSADTSADN